jgi:hypothetical protein
MVKSKSDQCLVIGIIHTLRLNTFIFFMVLMCYCFTFGTQVMNVNLNLMHPQHFKLLKTNKKQGRYEVQN